MGLAAVAFLYDAYWSLMFLLFAMGTQSAFFGPVKYAILPQHLKDSELVGGNALVEMGTFLRNPGRNHPGWHVGDAPDAKVWVSISVVVFAILGYLQQPQGSGCAGCRSNHPESIGIRPPNWPRSGVILARIGRSISIMAISWFWFLGPAI